MSVLVDALKRDDSRALLDILGPDARPLVFSGDDVADQQARRRFVDAYQAAHTIEAVDDSRATLVIGHDRWPFPIPLERREGSWHFDAAAGTNEILSRRIGRNERDAIQVSLAYVDAQREYAMSTHDNSRLPQYAQHFVSAVGRHDGLYWEAGPSEPESPLGPLVAKARAEGYRRDPQHRRHPYHGYYYRILTRQGPHAAGGAYDYVLHGKMIGGFALVATPATYGNSGVMTFLVNQDGEVFEKDLGPNSAALVQRMTSFDPDPGWARVAGAGAGAGAAAGAAHDQGRTSLR
jgi:hypothetical protein